MLDSELLRI